MRTLFIILSFLFSMSFYGQSEYKPFLKDGREWNIANIIYDDLESVYEQHPELYPLYGYPKSDTTYFSIFVDRDTIVDGHHGKILRTKVDGKERKYIYNIAYEENGKVFILFTDKNLLHLKNYPLVVLDFGLEKQDQWIHYSFGYWSDHNETVQEYYTDVITDTIEHNGELLRRVKVGSGYTGKKDREIYAVEGIGITHDFFFYYRSMAWGVANGIFEWLELQSVYDDGVCVFTKEDFYKEAVHPEANGIVETKTTNASSAIYDLTGRRLNSVPKSGMYIQGGKVKVAR